MSADFIKTISELHGQRYAVRFQQLIQNKIPCGFLCGFYVPQNLAEILNQLSGVGVNLTCICLVDNPQNLQASIPVLTLDELATNKPAVLLHFDGVYSGAFAEYCRRRYGIERLLFANPASAEEVYNAYAQHLPELYAVHENLADEKSRQIFRAAVKGRVTLCVDDFIYAPEPQYFLEGFLPTEGDIAIDGGAYDGATARDFAMQGAKVYAFEMSAENYQNCLARAEKYNFTIENVGLSATEGEEFYAEGNAASSKGHSNIVAKFTDLDTYVLKKNLPRVDYIKLDIEGAELDMLHGAAKSITRWKPKMAVSAYHKPEDLWTPATYIKSLRPDYEFQFRHYRTDCSDYVLDDSQREVLKRLGLSWQIQCVGEMVLYCR